MNENDSHKKRNDIMLYIKCQQTQRLGESRGCVKLLCKMFGLVNQKKKKERNVRYILYYISNAPKQGLLTQGVRAIKTLF